MTKQDSMDSLRDHISILLDAAQNDVRIAQARLVDYDTINHWLSKDELMILINQGQANIERCQGWLDLLNSIQIVHETHSPIIARLQ